MLGGQSMTENWSWQKNFANHILHLNGELLLQINSITSGQL